MPLLAFPRLPPFGLNARRKLPAFLKSAPEVAAQSGDDSGDDNSADVGEYGGGKVASQSPTLLFLHLWKCAGSSLRALLREWAVLEEQTIAIVVNCPDVFSEVGYLHGGEERLFLLLLVV